MGIVPASWMPICSMTRIITHWTAGGYKASSNDLSHYHILIEDDGKLQQGTNSIKDNVSTDDQIYAAHTLKKNTGSIGVSVCCMLDAEEVPFKKGDFPMTKTQWETMAQVVAELCDFYEIEITKRTVLGHGEVEQNLGVKQFGKWDPMVLPWDTSLSKSQVGDRFRDLVKAKMTGRSGLIETPASITAIIKGKTFREAQIFNEKSIIKIRPLIDTFGGAILNASDTGAMVLSLDISDEPIHSSFILIDHGNEMMEIPSGSSEADIVSLILQFGFVKATDLAGALNLAISWNGATRTVMIG